jgi:hypothetical protein
MRRQIGNNLILLKSSNLDEYFDVLIYRLGKELKAEEGQGI